MTEIVYKEARNLKPGDIVAVGERFETLVSVENFDKGETLLTWAPEQPYYEGSRFVPSDVEIGTYGPDETKTHEG